MKNALYAIAGTALVGMNSANAAINFTGEAVQDKIKGTTESAEIAIQNIVGNITLFLNIIAVLYFLWWGFNILTAAGDEEKVKKGRTVIVQALIGLVVIFLASTVVEWLLVKILA